MPFMFDYTYVLVLIGLALTFGASILVKTTFAKYSKIPTQRGQSGRDAALEVLRSGDVYDVGIGAISGNLTDHYDPQTKQISLSESVCDARSVAAVGVAAHEAGHALQHASGYSPIKLRMAIIPVCNFASRLATPLFLIGILMTSWIPDGGIGFMLMKAGILAFGVAVLFQVVTLPVEFNASRRAVAILSASGKYTAEELEGVKKVLTAAALTYVAGLAASLLQILRLVMIASNRRK